MAEENKNNEKVRVYADGIYDLFHFGHARSLEQAKKSFPNAYLLVGCCNDETTHKYKGKTVMTAAERYESLRHCKWVDEVIPDAPWVISQEFLDKHKIDFVAHDSRPYADTSGAGNDVYEFVKAVGKFKETQHTDGISTSDIIMRIVTDYNQYVMRNLDRGYSRKDIVVSYVEEAAVNSLQILKDISSDKDLKSKKSKKSHSGKKRKSLHIETTDSETDSIEIEGKKRPKKAHLHEATIEVESTKQKSYIDGSLSKSANAIDEKHKLKKSSTAKEESDSDGVENQNQNQKESLSQDFTNKHSQSNSSEEEREVAPQVEKTDSGVEKQPNKGALWAQKSSWTDLVGGTNVSFSISQLLRDTKFEEQEQPKNWFAAKPTIDRSSETVTKSTNGVAFPDVGSKSSLKVVKQRAVRAPLSYSVGETCSFMRSDASMKEWKSAKAALNASLRKKIDKKK